jgi:hypothetical protein
MTVLRWLRSDTANPAQRIYGVVFVPGAQSRSIREIASTNEFSYIRVKIRRPIDSVDTFYDLNEEYFSSFVRDTAPPESGSIVLQPGLIRRARFNLNLSALPPRSFVQRAELTVTVDHNRSRLSSRGLPDTLYLHLPELNTSTSLSKYSFSSTATLRAAGLRVDNGDGTSNYVFGRAVGRTATFAYASLAALVEQLNQSTFTDKALLFSLSQDADFFGESLPDRRETGDVARLVFFGTSDPNPKRRPTLSIGYSIRP